MSDLRPQSRKPSRRTARVTGALVIAGGLIGSAAIVWQASYSAFSATTENPTNNWTAGTVVLSDDDADSALFTVDHLKPGSTGSKCIVVTSTGNLASTVKLYATAGSFAQTRTLGDNLQLTVTQGTSTSTGGVCAGFVADTGAANSTTVSTTAFAAARTAFSNGFGTWAPAGTASGTPSYTKTYKIDYLLTSPATQTAVDAMQGGTVSLGFTWEAQNS